MKILPTVALLSLMAWSGRSEVIRVWSEAASPGDGTSWDTAWRDLSSAMDQATNGDEIWVARGIYMPAANADRTSSFALKSGVEIYGGFAGTETERHRRDPNPRTNGSVLSGDIDGNDRNDDGNFVAESHADVVGANSYHVVTVADVSGVVLDGFTVTAGQADGAGVDSQGGGMRCERSMEAVFANLLLSGNRADQGGGVYLYLSDINLERGAFERNFAGSRGGGLSMISTDGHATQLTLAGNVAGAEGGGVHFDEGDFVFIQSIFVGNEAAASGGGIYVSDGHPLLSQSVIAWNFAGFGGGGIGGDTLDMHNSIVWHNPPLDPFGALFVRADHCLIEGGVLGGENVITNAPMFVRDPDLPNDDFGDLRLLAGSPAIDAGNNALLPEDVADLDGDGQATEPLPVDFAGRDRILHDTVDLGPYEGGFTTFAHLYPALEPEEDANGNGYSNIGEYAFITDPTAPGVLSNRPRIRRTNDMLVIEFTQRANAADLELILSRTSDLIHWAPAEEGNDYEILDRVSSGDHAESQFTVLELHEESPQQFYRMEIRLR